jgi:hypothetical protein
VQRLKTVLPMRNDDVVLRDLIDEIGDQFDVQEG